MKYLLYLLLSTSALVGCVADELSMLVLGSRSIVILPEGSARVAITSGNGDYAAVSSHPEIATVELQNDTLLLSAISLGTTTVTVTDSKGQDAALTVTVGTKTVRFTIAEYTLQIEPEETPEREAIETALQTSVPLPVGARYECEYLTANRLDGNLTVIIPATEEDEELQYTGTFTEGAETFTFQYNNQTYIYRYESSSGPSKATFDTPYLLFLEDETALTEEYKARFPDAGLTFVSRGQMVRISQ